MSDVLEPFEGPEWAPPPEQHERRVEPPAPAPGWNGSGTGSVPPSGS